MGDTLKMSTDYTSAGNHTFYFTARDSGFLSVQHELTLTVNNVNQVPVWNGNTAIPAIDENKSLQFYVGDLVTDPDSGVVIISLDSTILDTVKIENPVITRDILMMATNYTSAGNYTFYLSARDEDSLVVQNELTLTVNNVNQVPVWDSTFSVIPAIDEFDSLQFYVGDLVTDPDGEVVIISLDSTVLNTVKIENPFFTGDTLRMFTDYNSAGNYNFYFSASDGTDSTTLTFNLTVNDVEH